MLWWIFQTLVVAALLAGVVWMVCGTTRIGPAARHALWLVVLIKLLTPPLVVWPWGVPSFFTHLDSPPITAPFPIAPDRPPAPSSRTHDVHIIPLEAASSPEVWEASPTPSSRDTSNNDVILSPIGDGVASHKLVDPAGITTTWSAWLVRTGGAVWLAGAIWFALLQAIRILRMSLRLRGGKRPNEELAGQVAMMAAQLGMLPIEARVVNGLGSPCVWSVVRPRLLWPAELPSPLPLTAMQGLIVHELAHVKRRDHWVGWLELVGGCVWWWNPLVWYVRHQLRENAELACDAWVVGTLPTGRRAYAEALLAVCECVSKFSAPLPSVGATAGSRGAFERRLKMIARGKTQFRLSRGGLLAALVLAATALPAWSQRSSVSQYEQLEAGSDKPPGFRFSWINAPALPDAAQKLYHQYEQREEEARRDAEQQAAERRQALLRELKALQDQYTREGLLDEAVAVRDHIRSLQPQAHGSAVPRSTPIDLTQYRGQDGNQVVLRLVGDTSGTVWGSNPYTDDSSVAAAAVHAGVLQPGKRGTVRIMILNGAPSYEGSTRNGVSSSSYGPWAGSFRIEVPPAEDSVQADPGTLTEFRDLVGQTLAFRVTGDTSGTVWGSGVYTDDSSLATAAVHAGILQPGQTGVVRVKILPGRDSYEGSTTGSVTTRSYGPWEGSFQFVDEGDAKPQAAVDATPRSEMGGMTPISMLSAYRGKVGETFQAIIVGSTEGSVWGTDTYTDDSSLAAAAVHAGVLKDGEQGVVRVTILEGQPEYEGSTRNGITSSEWGNWGGSFRVEPVEKTLEPARIPAGLVPDVDADAVR